MSRKTWRLIASTLFFTLLAPITLTVLVPWLILRTNPADQRNARFLAGLALIVCGALMYVWCAWDFINAGHGTPAPYDAPKLLVRRGLYRYSRNPMYLGLTAALAGEAILFLSLEILIYLLVVVTGFHLRVVLYQERVLRKNLRCGIRSVLPPRSALFDPLRRVTYFSDIVRTYSEEQPTLC